MFLISVIKLDQYEVSDHWSSDVSKLCRSSLVYQLLCLLFDVETKGKNVFSILEKENNEKGWIMHKISNGFWLINILESRLDSRQSTESEAVRPEWS